MSIQKFTLALKDFDFPLVSKMRGISVTIPSLDQEREVPQPMWIENVMPTSRGVITVEYSEDVTALAAPNVPELNTPDMRKARVYNLITQDGDVTYYCITDIYHFIFQPESNAWEVVEDTNSIVTTDRRTSIFNYKGRTIIFHPDLGFFSYTLTNDVFVKVDEPVSGVVESNFVSAGTSGAYIVTADENTIYWSSPLSGNAQGDVIEFNPDNLTLAGAGSSKALDLLGDILVIVPAPQGFYIYTEVNCVFAAATKQAANPWFFSEVENAAGGYSYELITHANNAGLHFNWSDTGLLQIKQKNANQIFPQVTEFLTGNVWEDYNSVTKKITQQLGVQYEVKMKFLSGRYLCFSYGKYTQDKEYILVLDTALQRWGKLKIRHLDVFDFVPPKRTQAANSTFADFQAEDGTDSFGQFFNEPFRQLLPKDYESNFRSMSFGILRPDFSTVTADFSEQTEDSSGVIIYGGIALTRNRLCQLNNIELAGIFDPEELEAEVKTEDTAGQTWFPTFYDDIDLDYKIDTVGKEHQLRLEGKFQLSTIVVAVTQLGRA